MLLAFTSRRICHDVSYVMTAMILSFTLMTENLSIVAGNTAIPKLRRLLPILRLMLEYKLDPRHWHPHMAIILNMERVVKNAP